MFLCVTHPAETTTQFYKTLGAYLQIWIHKCLLVVKEMKSHFLSYLLGWAGLSVAGSLVFRWLTVRVTEIVLDDGVVIYSFTDHFLSLDTFKKRKSIIKWRVVSLPKGEACITFFWESTSLDHCCPICSRNTCLLL